MKQNTLIKNEENIYHHIYIKNKLSILKHGEIAQVKIFLPITKHLKQIEYKLDGKMVNTSDKLDRKNKDTSGSIIKKDIEDKGTDTKFVIDEITKTEDLVTPLLIESSSNEDNQLDFLKNYASLPKLYITKMFDDKEKDRQLQVFDYKYGIRYENGKFHIGNSPVEIHPNGDIEIKNKLYTGTKGLYELLFKKNPISYTEDDKKNYKKIALTTNLILRYYQPNQQIYGSILSKYKDILANIYATSKDVTTKKKGGILMKLTDNKRDDIYWDNPNELVERLKLLLSSYQAGNTGLINEINSIIEELREANIIY